MSVPGTVAPARAEEKLLVAACDLLAEVGPRAASVRSIAARAGVNHGLVHHYFGSKDALLRAAMVRLVHEHAETARERANGSTVPVPLGLVDERRYLHAVVRCILDGETELARTEIEEDVSVPKAAYAEMVSRRGGTDSPARMKAIIGMGMAIEMGWAAVEPFIAAVAGIKDDAEMAEVRREAVVLRNEIARNWFA